MQESRTESGLTKKTDASVIIYLFFWIGLNTLLVYKPTYSRSKHDKDSDDYCSSDHTLF